MAFLRTRKIGKAEYYSACETLVKKGRTKLRKVLSAVEYRNSTTKTIQRELYYFGKNRPSKSGWEAVMNALAGKDVYGPGGPLMAKETVARVSALNKRMKTEFAGMSMTERRNFDEKFLNDYIYNTNSIEGSTLTKDETYFVTHENQGVAGKQLKEIYMARNLMAAAQFLEKYAGGLDLTLVRKLHSLVQENIQPREELGRFKKRQNYITGTEFLPTPPGFVQKRMGGLLRWHGKNRKKYHPFELAAIFHIKFVSIHPFPDGNGRTARLLHSLVLQKGGMLPIIYRAETKHKYYSALRAAQIYGSHEPFLDYSVEEFVATYEEY